ncbi:MAG: hypothetical protein GXP33_07845 [Spirochaetes bacterium]|nr:hypothetical protein [Spirochaetota bacterium]
MLNLAQILEEKLSEAVNVKDEKALKRYINLLVESVMERQKANEQFVEIRGGIKVLAETMQEGFRRIDKRFETADKRFEDLNKRIGFMSWFTPTIITILLTLIMAAMKFL